MKRSLILFLTLLILAGCTRDPLVRTFQVPKEPVPTAAVAAENTDRMLVGMVSQDDRVWFIKAVGPVDQMAPVADRLKQLVSTVTFNDSGEPEWELPDGWSQTTGNAIRFATLSAGTGSDAPQVSVIALPAPQEVLANLNRWRDQLGLAPIAARDLPSSVETLPGDGFEITWIDLSGRFTSSSSAPFANTARGDPPRAEAASDVPNHWEVGRAGGMRKAAYRIQDGEGSAEVTVIVLGELPLLDNVNRWREQIGLSPIDEAQLDTVVQSITAGPLQGDYVQLVGEVDGAPTTLLAVMVNHQGQSWFFKMMGDSAVVDQEKEAFERFVQSASF